MKKGKFNISIDLEITENQVSINVVRYENKKFIDNKHEDFTINEFNSIKKFFELFGY